MPRTMSANPTPTTATEAGKAAQHLLDGLRALAPTGSFVRDPAGRPPGRPGPAGGPGQAAPGMSRHTAVPEITIVEALGDPHLFAAWFRPLPSWASWVVVLKALFGLAMTPAEVEVFRRFTQRDTPPSTAAREAYLVCGRRAGKSAVAALIAVFLACFKDYRHVLRPGERGVVMVLAADREQARVVFSYIEALLDQVPLLRTLIAHRTKEEITLRNRITLRVHTASFRSVRGYTVVAAILDEVAFWRSEDSANPDVEIVNALRPAMATVPEPLLLAISSPYARRGIVWESYRQHYGRDGDPVLIWQAPTAAMNPTIPQSFIRAELEKDEASARAEYLAEFRVDIETFLSREIVEACVEPGCHGRPPLPGIQYVGFVDPSGGVGDSFALAIAHPEGDDVVLDFVHERRAPLSPEATVEEFVGLLKPYRVREVIGDRYSEEWVRERFRTHGIDYTVSRWTKSEIYGELLPLLASRRARLLDQPRLVAQFLSLERRTGASGRHAITHPRDGHDDVANSVAGALVHVTQRGQPGFEGWKPYVPQPARPVVGVVEIFEQRWYSCPNRCGWQDLAPVDPTRCPKCNPRGPTSEQILSGW